MLPRIGEAVLAPMRTGPGDRASAISYPRHRHAAGEILTGLLLCRSGGGGVHGNRDSRDTPPDALNEGDLNPLIGARKINESLR